MQRKNALSRFAKTCDPQAPRSISSLLPLLPLPLPLPLLPEALFPEAEAAPPLPLLPPLPLGVAALAVALGPEECALPES